MSVWVHFKLICKKYLVCVQYTDIPTGFTSITFRRKQEIILRQQQEEQLLQQQQQQMLNKQQQYQQQQTPDQQVDQLSCSFNL